MTQNCATQNPAGRLRGRNIVVTGASRGIGKAIAQAYAREGANLFLTATRLDLLNALRKELAEFDINIACCAADLTSEAALTDMFEQAVQWCKPLGGQQGGQLHAWVNNAGIYIGKPFAQYALSEFDQLMKVNVYAVFQLMQLALSHMQAKGYGKIINISSTAGRWESANQAAYNTSKHAVLGMTKCAALEYAGHGVRVNAICPGMVNTDMFDQFKSHADNAGISLEQLKANTTTRIPIGRFLEPEEIAHVAVYLASAESDGMTGQSIVISGGMRMI
ncbi:MAG: SDR family oxidoreductase [Burkholderiaceae bacterium]